MATKIIMEKEISMDAVTKSIHGFVDKFLDTVFNRKRVGIPKIKEHIKGYNDKIIPAFVELMQLQSEVANKEADKITMKRIKESYNLFKIGFEDAMEQTKFSFYQIIYEAWTNLFINLANEAYKSNNKEMWRLLIAVYKEMSEAYTLADKSRKGI